TDRARTPLRRRPAIPQSTPSRARGPPVQRAGAAPPTAEASSRGLEERRRRVVRALDTANDIREVAVAKLRQVVEAGRGRIIGRLNVGDDAIGQRCLMSVEAVEACDLECVGRQVYQVVLDVGGSLLL